MYKNFQIATNFLLCLYLGLLAQQASAFKFSDDSRQEQVEQDAKTQHIAHLLSTPCREKLKNKKIMLIIGEQHNNGPISAQQNKYSAHVSAINLRLRALGLKTYSQEAIREQIAQAEIDAHFRNDPDAALSASKRLGANFILRGLIATTHSINPTLGINEVALNMGFILTHSSGKIVSNANANSDSFSNADVATTALKLLNEKADGVVARLYSDYCKNAKN